MLLPALLLLALGEKAFAPAATAGRPWTPRATAPIAPQQVAGRPSAQAAPAMQHVSEDRSSVLLTASMVSNVLICSGIATLAAGAGLALRRSSTATGTELTQVLDAERGARTVAPVMLTKDPVKWDPNNMVISRDMVVPDALSPAEERKLKLEIGTNWPPRTSTVRGEGYQFFQGPTPLTGVQPGLPDFFTQFSPEERAGLPDQLLASRGKVFFIATGVLSVGLLGVLLFS